jgi:hypothetical protein
MQVNYSNNDDLQPIRREVDADNSCLFSSLAYLLDKANFNELNMMNRNELNGLN